MRRFRPTTTFGSVSRHERRNADRFFADLMGAAPRAALPSPREDSPYETVFDRAESAEAEWAAAEALPEIDEADPTITKGRDDDEIIVTRADGTKYHLRRKVRVQVYTPGSVRTGLCTDDERVFFRICWCKGTRGTIDVGANPQGAFAELVKKVGEQINRGEDPEQIKQTIENASIQTFLKADIAKGKDWLITGDIQITINRTGFTGGTAALSFDKGWIKLGVQGSVSPDEKKVVVTVDIPLGKRTPPKKECPKQQVMVWWDIECLKEVPVTITIKPPVDCIDRTEKLFLYFDYMKDTLRRDPAGTAKTAAEEVEAILKSDPTIGTARLNKRALERLDHLVGQGYWLTSVDGYTSPEGPRRLSGAAEGAPCSQMLSDPRAPKWEGNNKLSCERAEKVRKLVIERYRPGLGMRPWPPIMKLPPGQRLPEGVGRSENPALSTSAGKELEGDALRRFIINGDPAKNAKPFLDEHPDERARMTAEDQAFVADTRNSVKNRAEKVFENLRRVEVNVKYCEPLKPGVLKTFNLVHEQNCAEDLVQAAEKQWGSRIPFVRRDPPVCMSTACDHVDRK